LLRGDHGQIPGSGWGRASSVSTLPQRSAVFPSKLRSKPRTGLGPLSWNGGQSGPAGVRCISYSWLLAQTPFHAAEYRLLALRVNRENFRLPQPSFG
jgi:hypothetical protein